ncbi:MAG: hypothetical protein ABI690_13900 [Chloroflexota bacterium]
MTRRKERHSSTRERQSTRENGPRGKSEAEARIERLTWFFLVVIFAAAQILESIPPVVVPLAGAGILLGSGIYQYSRRWRVSPVTWLAGALMAGLAYVNLQVNPTRDFTGLALLVFAGVILFGLLTGET